MTILDAGQADCIVIQSPAKRTYVIDTGVEKKRNPATEKIIPYLRNQGVQTIEAVIITHADADHFGGAAVLFKSFPVKALWLSECSRVELKPTWQKAISTALDKGILVKDIKRGDLIRRNSSLSLILFLILKSKYYILIRYNAKRQIQKVSHSR